MTSYMMMPNEKMSTLYVTACEVSSSGAAQFQVPSMSSPLGLTWSVSITRDMPRSLIFALPLADSKMLGDLMSQCTIGCVRLCR